MDEFNMLGQNKFHFQWAFNLNHISQLSMANNKQIHSAAAEEEKQWLQKLKRA